MQSEVADGRLKVEKVHTDANPADLMTKNLNHDKLETHLEKLNFAISTTRAETAPELLGHIGPRQQFCVNKSAECVTPPTRPRRGVEMCKLDNIAGERMTNV